MENNKAKAGTVAAWLGSFQKMIRAGAPVGAELFLPEALWRDYLAFGWTLATHEGTEAIDAFQDKLGTLEITNIEYDNGGAAESYFSFDIARGTVEGYLRLLDGKCMTLFTGLAELAGHPEAIGRDRWSGVVDNASNVNWKDALEHQHQSLGRTQQPYVLIVGAGQSGLALGARLKALGVPALLIDRYPDIGDQWRSRYKSLTLHDPVWYDHLPYMPYPANWPVYTPKDKMGDWLKLYAEAMELTVWTSTELVDAWYDESDQTWTAKVKRGDDVVTLYPTQLVLAVGNAGFPRWPAIPGAADFNGPQHHSSDYKGGDGFTGKRVAIVGANNSAHDIAADLVDNDARPTLIQRTSTLVVKQTTMFDKITSRFYSEDALAAGIATERADLMFLATPLRLMERYYQPVWKAIAEIDKAFYDALAEKGFVTDFAEDGTGMVLKYHRSASGYYIDVGASQMIIDGRIEVKSGQEIAGIEANGIRFANGDFLTADAIVYATGFGSMEEWAARLLGSDVAEKIGRCWGYGSGCKGDPGPWEGELRNMWKPTAQNGLWFMGGNLQQVRIFSRYLALQLKARFEGLDTTCIDPLHLR